MGNTLYVAAGGGGDAITATALAHASHDLKPVVMTYSWDRLMVDPVPGPRSASDFTGLRELAPHVLEVVTSTTSISPAASSLPRLAGDLPARLLLLDPTEGAVGMSAQIRAAAAFFHFTEIAILDVGGDILTDGTDPGLRSPLADQLALAACVRATNSISGEIANVYVAAPGIDGELSAKIIFARFDSLNALLFRDLNPQDFAPIRNVFRWHPSEASGLLAAAADGLKGLVEVRDAGDQVELTHETTRVFVTDARSTAETTPARHLMESQSLAQAEEIIRTVTGISEIRYEIEKAIRIQGRPIRVPERLDLPTIDTYAHEAEARGARYISMRRLAELLQASSLDAYAELCELLAEERPDNFQPSVYRTKANRSQRRHESSPADGKNPTHGAR